MTTARFALLAAAAFSLPTAACSQAPSGNTAAPTQTATPAAGDAAPAANVRYLSQPLVKEIYTADPSAHVFNGRIYVYPSHDIDAGIPDDDLGNQYAMRDYRVLSMDRIGGPVTIHDVALDVKDVPWASKQMWAPDAAYKNGTYFLYFPVKDKQGIFRIGVATSKSPTGPFKADPQPMQGTYSMDPAVFTDADGTSYLYVGGIWGGQLQNWATGTYNKDAGVTDLKQDDKPALMPRIARLDAGMKQIAEPLKEVQILDEQGKPVLGGDHDRRFFEASWVFKRGNTYYFTYSTGDTHKIAYATGTSPYGPFTYRGVVLNPVQGWTNHHSIVQVGDQWHLFYHDTQLSGKNHLRNVKTAPLTFNADGTIQTVEPLLK
ncbi:Glycosyl hydrolases family 43 [Sphingomonas guangdongensis]|uniref:Glycosyl hydrolases family 43 n=1 Tax=Sphingomonas guangdongensis TaxID=1141890 RepID=A0A285R103_9SPHN|nr:glycoside hydrolase family 43 protein [Sphingomonas guangdongensis]SOB87389.1 Glycosyl hydrolases family 43 [Sphingomonas guangdongensis]